MAKALQSGSAPAPRTLILSQRLINTKVYQCGLYEFEDAVAGLTNSDMILPRPAPDGSAWQAPMRRARNHLARVTGQPHMVRTNWSTEAVRDDYDVFFAALLFPSQALVLNHVQGWAERAKTKICFLGEVWLKQFNETRERQFLELLKPFDHIFLHTVSSVPALSQATGRPCHALPIGVDAVRFSPACPPAVRCTDVYSMGRRSEVTHRALLDSAERDNLFYLYDTAGGFDVLDPREHRLLLASIIKRSRYFIAYSHNANIANITGGQEELGARLFEGTAGGAILLGRAPESDGFRQHFDWDDAVIPVPFEAGNITEILAELDAQPERIAKARQHNVVNALLRHDWAYRWRRMMEIADVPPGPKVVERLHLLQTLADRARSA